jgi:hypothetical protein
MHGVGTLADADGEDGGETGGAGVGEDFGWIVVEVEVGVGVD